MEEKSFVEYLEDAVAEKTEILMGMTPGSKEHQMATQDIKTMSDMIIQLKKAENDMNASDDRLELDRERLEMERQKFEHQIENEGEEVDYRNERDKRSDRWDWIKWAASLGVSVATLIAWIGMTSHSVKIDNSDMIPSGTTKRLFGLLQPFQQIFRKNG